MIETQKKLTPQAFLEELQQIKLKIKSEGITPEGKEQLLKQAKKLETLALEMKNKLFTDKQQS